MVMSMFQTPGFKEEDGKVIMTAPTFFSCGCGGVTARLSSVLVYVGISGRQLNQVKPAQHVIAKRYIEQENLKEYIPLLDKHQYGVLIDNKLTDGKHKWVDIMQGAATHTADLMKDILDVSEPNSNS